MVMLGLFSVASLFACVISCLMPVLVALVPGTTPITGTALCLHVPWMTWCVSCCCLLIPYYGRSWFPFLFLGRAGCGLRIW
jgi:hypothetical protein